MSLDEFYDLCKSSGVINGFISAREINFCFVQAMSTQVDEYYKKRHFEMSFVEFLEAFSRVCDMRDCETKSLKLKLEDCLKNLIPLCSKSIIENFSIPDENTYHGLMFRYI